MQRAFYFDPINAFLVARPAEAAASHRAQMQ
jgi:hypothetical protein